MTERLEGSMTGQEPKYQRVITWIKENIESGNLKYGERIQSENELSEMFGLSRQTIRRATAELESQHILTRVQGSGTYIGDRISSIKRERHMNVAVMSTYLDGYIFPTTLKGIETTLAKSGYTTQLSFTDDRIMHEADILESLLEKGDIDGLIAEPSKSALPNPNLRLYKEFARRNIPVLFFNASYPSLHMPCVRIDDEGIAKAATDLLIRNGHKKIGGIFKCDDGQGQLRYYGYTQALLKSRIKTNSNYIIWVDNGALADLTVLDTYIFDRLKECSAVVCYNDEAAFQLIGMALRKGLRVPEDLSIVSFDDSELARISPVPFTSFAHPKELLGRKVAENLIRMIEEPGFDGNYLFKSEPVFRNSIRDMDLPDPEISLRKYDKDYQYM